MSQQSDFIDTFSRLLTQFQEQSPQVARRSKDRQPPSISRNDDEYEKHQALYKALKCLSKIAPEDALDKRETDSYVCFFENLYGGEDRYRHMYSKICELMYDFFNEEDKNDDGVPFRAVNLASSMEVIADATKSKFGDDRITHCVKKLQDHIELENTRMYYMAKQNAAQINNAARLSEALDGLDGRFSDTQDKLQRNYVAILGIFAAIVVGFTGGLSFTTSALESIDAVSIYRLLFMVLVIGLFIFDLIASMYFFICLVSKFKEWKSLRALAIALNVIIAVLIVLTGVAQHYSWLG